MSPIRVKTIERLTAELEAEIESLTEDLSVARQSLYKVAAQRDALTAENSRLRAVVDAAKLTVQHIPFCDDHGLATVIAALEEQSTSIRSSQSSEESPDGS